MQVELLWTKSRVENQLLNTCTLKVGNNKDLECGGGNRYRVSKTKVNILKNLQDIVTWEVKKCEDSKITSESLNIW